MSTGSAITTTPFPVPAVRVLPWPDVVIDQMGVDPRSPYVERYWLGLLGPSATWLVRRLADGLDAAPEGFELDLLDTACDFSRTLAKTFHGHVSGDFTECQHLT